MPVEMRLAQDLPALISRRLSKEVTRPKTRCYNPAMAKGRKRTCPHCKRSFTAVGLADRPSFPFCCDQCRLLDLGRWLNNEYAVVEDLSRGQELKARIPEASDVSDPDMKAALDELDT